MQLRTAGMKVAMVTGDAATTAVAIARQVGIIGENSYTDNMSSFHLNGTNNNINHINCVEMVLNYQMKNIPSS